LALDTATLERQAPQARIIGRRKARRWVPSLPELWRSRTILYYLVVRDIKARYAQTVLGAFWTVFQPLAMIGVFTYAFSRFFHDDSLGVPYTLWATAGIALWIFVSRSVMQGAGSLVGNVPFLTRTAVQRPLIPISAVCASCVDLLVGIALFLVLSTGYGVYPTWRYVLVPAVVVLAFLLALGLALLLSPLEVRFRDVGRTLPFVVQLWFFLSPVAYVPPTSGSELARLFLTDLNPAVGLLESFRWALLGTEVPSSDLIVTLVFTAVVLLAGAVYFTRSERMLVDEL
jgi:lipopolysaccharide transport system permease protein